jgi:hypothetical protein
VRSVPLVLPVRRLPLDALEVEISIAEGEPALQALLTWVRERAGQREAHDAEKGLCKRRLPLGLAAIKLYFAQRGTGEVGPGITQADGGVLPREPKRRRRDYCSRCGTFAVARTCDRTPGAPGSLPLDAQITLPARCDSYLLQAGMTGFAVEHPVTESADFLAQLVALEVAASVLMEVAQEASEDDEGF